MPRPRKPAESAYERRIRRYLELHPGATRQEARGHRKAAGKSEYQTRIERAQAKRPGISRAAAAGHGSRDERQVAALLRELGRTHKDTIVSFLGLDRQADGTWRRAGFDLLDGELLSFEFGGEALRRLPEVADAITAAGLTLLGAKYLQQMVDWAVDNLAKFLARRRGRWFKSWARNGRSVTVAERRRATLVGELDRPRLEAVGFQLVPA